MANFFSVDYWKALYFKAMGGQETAVDPNAMSGSWSGSSSWTGTADATGSSAGDMSGSFAGSSSFTGDLKRKRDGDAGPAQRKKRRINIIAPSLQWARDNLGRFLGPNADKTKIEALLAAEKAAAGTKITAVAAITTSPDVVALAVAEQVAALSIDDDEDEIIALLLAA